MKQLMVDGANGPIVEELQLRPLDANQVLIKNSFSLISAGTELHYIDQCRETNQRLKLGYCVAGIVESCGENVTSVLAGQAVIAMGWEYACHAEYVQVPCKLVLPVPKGLDLQQALMANLLATAVHACDRGMLEKEDKVLVVGAGLVGRLVAAYAQTISDNVVITDHFDARLDSIKNIATDTCDALLSPSSKSLQAFTKAFICIKGDATQWIQQLPRLMRNRGNENHRPRIIGVGRFTANVNFSVEMGNIDIVFSARCGEGYRDDDHVHGIDVKKALPGEATVECNLKRALTSIQNGKIDLSDLRLRTTNFSDVLNTYSTLKDSPKCLGVVINYAN